MAGSIMTGTPTGAIQAVKTIGDGLPLASAVPPNLDRPKPGRKDNS
jgi:hypothetical protein